MRRSQAVLWLMPVSVLALMGASVAAGLYALLGPPRSPFAAPAEIASICVQVVLDNGLHWWAGGLLALLLALGGAGWLVAVIRALRRWRIERRLLRNLAANELAFTRAGLPADQTKRGQMRVLSTRSPLAFTHGILRPRVYVSIRLLQLLNEEELDAVLAHEEFHRRMRHPLQRLLLTALRDAFFFAPAVRRACDRLVEAQELDADAAVCRGQPVARVHLAAALEKLLGEATSVGIPFSSASERSEFWERRVQGLVTGRWEMAPLRTRDWLLTALTMALPLALVVITTDTLTMVHSAFVCTT